ncbi:MAG: peroxiredoxin [Actinobacteria bacterium HGW-Actinobacteria-4]|nr:MAG: peroxiredoxin [Actinobacteria bacterium HGW-Actinobacteria-4]
MTHALVGKPAPTFTLTDQHGRAVSLEHYRGRAVLVVFVPFAFSDTCSSELVDLRDASDLADTPDMETVVISCDSIYTLKAWADEHHYTGELLSDFWPHGQVARAYGVFHPHKGLATRGSFLVDAEGVCRWALVNPPGEARDVDDYRNAITLLV